MIAILILNVVIARGSFITHLRWSWGDFPDLKVYFSVTDPMWIEAENNFDQFLDKFIIHELTKDENDNANNNVSFCK